jgi:hypothetical protein
MGNAKENPEILTLLLSIERKLDKMLGPVSPSRVCAACGYWNPVDQRRDESSASAVFGECRRYPPSRVAASEGSWPTTQMDEWCGEFKENARKRSELSDYVQKTRFAEADR